MKLSETHERPLCFQIFSFTSSIAKQGRCESNTIVVEIHIDFTLFSYVFAL